MRRTFVLLLLAAVAGPAAGQPAAPKEKGIESEGYVWNQMEGEKVEALDLKGDAERGEEAYEVCSACHLPSGAGRPDGTFPQLAGQHSTVLIKQIADIRAGRRDNPIMYPFAKTLVDPQELAEYDGIIFGSPTRFGNMTSQMRNFLDQTGPLWVNGALIGKVGSVFTSTSTGGGNETTIVSFHWTLLHHGMIIVGLPYSAPDLPDVSEVKGGSPYGASTIAGADGSRQPSAVELEGAKFQGRHVAQIAIRRIANHEEVIGLERAPVRPRR